MKLSKPKWTAKDHASARRQGWEVGEAQFVGEVVFVIQRAETRVGPRVYRRFPSDDAAKGYVVGRWELGCKLARKALLVIDTAYRTVGEKTDWDALIA